MTDPVALFITWTTYGSWLPGDERGHVSNILHPGAPFQTRQNRPGTPYAAGNAYTRARAQSIQSWSTVRLTCAEAVIVADSLVNAAAKRDWMILRAAVMSNHVHVLASRCPIDGPAVRRILKGNTQADLSAAAGSPRRWWTAGGSDRRRLGESSIEETIRYIADQPGKLAEIVANAAIVPTPVSERRGSTPPK